MPRLTKAAPRFKVQVVFPTPPFSLVKDIMRKLPPYRLLGLLHLPSVLGLLSTPSIPCLPGIRQLLCLLCVRGVLCILSIQYINTDVNIP